MLAQRKPRLSLRLAGGFLLRLRARRFDGLALFQLPPRFTRFEPLPLRPQRMLPHWPRRRDSRSQGPLPATEHPPDGVQRSGAVLVLGRWQGAQVAGHAQHHPKPRQAPVCPPQYAGFGTMEELQKLAAWALVRYG